MKYSWIDTELLQKPGVTKDLQAEWNWIRIPHRRQDVCSRLSG